MYLQVNSSNDKLVGKIRQGICAAVTLPIKQTCPKTCELLKSRTCYAMFGPLSMYKVKRLEKASRGMSPEEIACAAASEMDEVRRPFVRGRPLRLFEAGDARTPNAAAILAASSRHWMQRGGGARDCGNNVWGYTHAWRTVPRDAWAGVSMLASVEARRGDEQSAFLKAREAIDLGYVPALVVPYFPSDTGERAFVREGVRYIPCPAQTRPESWSCVTCRLCFDDKKLARRGAAIAFAAHGIRAPTLRRHLAVVSDRDARRDVRRSGTRERGCFVPTSACANLVWR